jgi:hypothetical protein
MKRILDCRLSFWHNGRRKKNTGVLEFQERVFITLNIINYGKTSSTQSHHFR